MSMSNQQRCQDLRMEFQPLQCAAEGRSARSANLFVRGIFLMSSFGRKSQQIPAGDERTEGELQLPVPCPREGLGLGSRHIPDLAVMAGQKIYSAAPPSSPRKKEPNRSMCANYSVLSRAFPPAQQIDRQVDPRSIEDGAWLFLVTDEPWQIGCVGGGGGDAVVLRENAPQ